MLRLPIFKHHQPGDIETALELLAGFAKKGEPAKLIAGGTDLVPNMKHEIEEPAHVVSLRGMGLTGVRREGPSIVIGAMTPLDFIAKNKLINEYLPALAKAVGQIAGPQLRVMGTIGGNVCLDTRCLYINQTYFWRNALGFCLKKDGDVCHVVKGGKRCVAAASNDSALPLILYKSRLKIRRAGSERDIELKDFYTANGINNRNIAPDEILTEISVPIPDATVACSFEKLRVRKAIDFSLVNVAVLIDSDKGFVDRMEMVISSLGAKPKFISLSGKVRGNPFDSELIDYAARRAYNACKPLTNIATDPEWRREMVPVLVKRALENLRSD